MRVVLLAALVLVTQVGWCATNLLENPGLEVDADGNGVADGWTGEVHTGDGAQGSFAIDAAQKHSGAACQRIDHTSDNAAWVRVSADDLPVKPETVYRLSLWVRSEAKFSVLVYEFRKGDLPYITTTACQGDATDGWQQFTKTFTTTKDAAGMRVSLIATGKGSVWFDDAELAAIAERPTVKAPRATVAPTIDGDLSDKVWQKAGRVGGYFALGGGGEAAAVQTSAQVAFDDQAAYLGFECDEPNVAGLVRKTTTDAASVWSDDLVEVFLSTSDDPRGYLHLGVSAGGGKWQERGEGRTWYTNWYSPQGAGAGNLPQWQAAVKVADGRWTAELRVPFDWSGTQPRAGKVWALQLCRTRRAGGGQEFSTWSYTEGTRFAVPEQFGKLVFSAGPSAPPKPVKRELNPDTYQPLVVPQPVRLQWTPGAFRVTPQTVIRIADPDQRPEAEWLRDDVKGRFGLELAIQDATTPAQAGKSIDLGAKPGDDLAAGDEAYGLQVSADGISLAARGARGRLYGVATIRQLLAKDAQGPFVRSCVIHDEPSLKWRAWHMSSPKVADLPTYKHLVDVLALLKYNTIVWEVDGDLKYESHPEIAREGAPTKAQLRELVDYAKLRRFEVIPQFASFSHYEFVLEKHPELAENTPQSEGRVRLANYCPSNPDTYKLTFDLMQEVVDVFQPRYFHIGHDESCYGEMCVCDRCKGRNPWDVWAADINKLDAWIRERGMRTCMWGDQLLEEHTGGAPMWTTRATDLVSKGILIFDWHYDSNHDYDRTLGYFQQHGFEVVGCPWYEPENVYGFATAAKRKGVLGYCGSTWYGVRSGLTAMPHMPTAWLLGAENAWSTDAPKLAEITYHPVPEFNRLWRLGQADLPDSFRLLDLSGFCNVPLTDTERRDGWMGEGPLYDLRVLGSGTVWADDVPFGIADATVNGGKGAVMLADATTPKDAYPDSALEIPIGLKTKALYFLQTCSVPATRDRDMYATTNPKGLGWYTIAYDDGQQVKLPVQYLATVHDWNGQRGPAQAVGLWEGKTQAGALISLGAWEWVNPRPDVAIASVDFASAMAAARPVLLGITAAGGAE